MRKIKFRGRYVGDYAMDEYIAEGTMLYGGYVEIDGKPFIIPKNDVAIQVTSESVAQLIGIDSNGKEVYEGDEVVDKFGEKYVAQLTPTLRENHEGAGGVFSKPTERFWTERRQYTPLTLVEQCT